MVIHPCACVGEMPRKTFDPSIPGTLPVQSDTEGVSGVSTPPSPATTILASSASTSTRRNTATTVAPGPSGNSTLTTLPASTMIDNARGSMR